MVRNEGLPDIRCCNRIINGYEHAREISPGGAQLLGTPPYHSVTSFHRFQVGFLTVASLRDCGQIQAHGSQLGVGFYQLRLFETVDKYKLIALSLASGLTVASLRDLALGHVLGHRLFYRHIVCPQYTCRYSFRFYWTAIFKSIYGLSKNPDEMGEK